VKSAAVGAAQSDCLIKASKAPKAGTRIDFGDGFSAQVLDRNGATFRVEFDGAPDVDQKLHALGRTPLPPYIRRDDADPQAADRKTYQTVYAREKGAVAAPTAGLHFTEGLLERLQKRGIRIAQITLHVGYGTFLPVKETDIRRHRMHPELYRISTAAAERINRSRNRGGRVVAVGTTCVRTLEHAAAADGRVAAGAGSCALFIYPGYRFKAVGAMITNFHLPRSTLLMLVSAFAGKENVLDAYREAVRERYRFYSYGDAMLIE
jgi:S-adenosylmethionine:tRNA ribosyltransferase-isomerase